MRKLLISAFAVSAIALSGVSLMAKDKPADKAGETVTGVLIDNACAAKDANKSEAGAAKHPKACALKCAKDGGFALVHGDHVMKLDEAGNKLAMKYLEGADATTTVSVTGTPDKEMTSIAVTDIKAGKAEKSEKHEKSEKSEKPAAK